MDFNSTKRVSFFLGEGNECPYIDSVPFYVTGPTEMKRIYIQKLPKTRKFPFAVYTDEDARVYVKIGGYSPIRIALLYIFLACLVLAAVYGIYKLILYIKQYRETHRVIMSKRPRNSRKKVK